MRLSPLSGLSLGLILAVGLTLGGCKKNEAAPGLPAPAAPAAPSPTATAPSEPPPAAPSPTAATPAPSKPGNAAPSPTAATPSEPPTAASAAPSGDGDLLKVLGQPCGSGDSCPASTSCETYYGIAGASGPAFKSCEIKCKSGSTKCPLGASCVTVSDGPGSVCRPQ